MFLHYLTLVERVQIEKFIFQHKHKFLNDDGKLVKY